MVNIWRYLAENKNISEKKYFRVLSPTFHTQDIFVSLLAGVWPVFLIDDLQIFVNLPNI